MLLLLYLMDDLVSLGLRLVKNTPPPGLELLMDYLVTLSPRLVKNTPSPQMKTSGIMCRELVCVD